MEEYTGVKGEEEETKEIACERNYLSGRGKKKKSRICMKKRRKNPARLSDCYSNCRNDPVEKAFGLFRGKIGRNETFEGTCNLHLVRC